MEKELSRLEKSILFILYKYDPIPMRNEEIIASIEKEGLMLMTDDEFMEWGRKMYTDKETVRKARLN